MNTYTLNDLQSIWDAKIYLPKERFIHYFTLRYGYTPKEADEAFRILSKFPMKAYGTTEDKMALDKIIPRALELVAELQKCWEMNSDVLNIKSSQDKELRKLIYSQDNEVKELILNLHDTNDIITYAELIKQGIKQIALLRFCTDITYKNSDKELLIFEGDFFDTRDEYFGVKSNVYVAQPNDEFRKLIYIKGKGYLIKGDLNYDDEKSYNRYSLTLNDWVKLGNIYTDIIKLTDDGDLK